MSSPSGHKHRPFPWKESLPWVLLAFGLFPFFYKELSLKEFFHYKALWSHKLNSLALLFGISLLFIKKRPYQSTQADILGSGLLLKRGTSEAQISYDDIRQLNYRITPLGAAHFTIDLGRKIKIKFDKNTVGAPQILEAIILSRPDLLPKLEHQKLRKALERQMLAQNQSVGIHAGDSNFSTFLVAFSIATLGTIVVTIYEVFSNPVHDFTVLLLAGLSHALFFGLPLLILTFSFLKFNHFLATPNLDKARLIDQVAGPVEPYLQWITYFTHGGLLLTFLWVFFHFGLGRIALWPHPTSENKLMILSTRYNCQSCAYSLQIGDWILISPQGLKRSVTPMIGRVTQFLPNASFLIEEQTKNLEYQIGAKDIFGKILYLPKVKK